MDFIIHTAGPGPICENVALQRCVRCGFVLMSYVGRPIPVPELAPGETFSAQLTFWQEGIYVLTSVDGQVMSGLPQADGTVPQCRQAVLN